MRGGWRGGQHLCLIPRVVGSPGQLSAGDRHQTYIQQCVAECAAKHGVGLRPPLNPRAEEGPDEGRVVGGRGGKEEKERELGLQMVEKG